MSGQAKSLSPSEIVSLAPSATLWQMSSRPSFLKHPGSNIFPFLRVSAKRGAHPDSKQPYEFIYLALQFGPRRLVYMRTRIEKGNAVSLQETVEQGVQHENGHVDVRVRPEVPPGNPGLYYRTQVFGRKKVYLLQKLGPKREFFLENHLEVDSINPGVALDKADSRQRAFFYSFEKIRT